ncbi:hypothetical protein ACO0LD_21225 [Undibacterium sp. Ji83W]|uniref:hypothetical protein n=1 Tax=Undibacterium sp. Ji83W TaxID=3413043 RepID=UPI003BF23BDD
MFKKLPVLSFILSSQIAMTGCAVVYDIGQDSNQRQCEKLQDWNERKTCLQQNKTTYEQYEKQREDLRTKGTEKQ